MNASQHVNGLVGELTKEQGYGIRGRGLPHGLKSADRSEVELRRLMPRKDPSTSIEKQCLVISLSLGAPIVIKLGSILMAWRRKDIL